MKKTLLLGFIAIFSMVSKAQVAPETPVTQTTQITNWNTLRHSGFYDCTPSNTIGSPSQSFGGYIGHSGNIVLGTENHINEYNHLPNIPSEAEVKENGIDIGDMQARLLQKIEELTLYMIKQQNEIKLLKEENIVINEKLANLKSK